MPEKPEGLQILGRRLREVRKQREMDKDTLAQLLKSPVDVVKAVEAGEITDLTILKRHVEALGATLTIGVKINDEQFKASI